MKAFPTTFRVTALALLGIIVGCNEPKSIEYYAEHHDEALKQLMDCRSMALKVQLEEPICVNPRKGYALYTNARYRANEARPVPFNSEKPVQK